MEDPMKRAIIFGHSHISAILDAIMEQRSINALPANYEYHVFHFHDPRYTPYLVSDGIKKTIVNPKIDAAIQSVAAGDSRFFISMAGNQYNYIALANHPQPFDFVLEEAPDLPLANDRQIVPVEVPRKLMHLLVRGYVRTLEHFRTTLRGPMYQLEAPPPIPSAEHMVNHPHGWEELIAAHGITPAIIRYKLWRLHSQIYRDACKELGITYVPAPEKALDRDGMLDARAWSIDPVHANAWYGHFVLEQITAAMTSDATDQVIAR